MEGLEFVTLKSTIESNQKTLFYILKDRILCSKYGTHSYFQWEWIDDLNFPFLGIITEIISPYGNGETLYYMITKFSTNRKSE